MGEINRREVLKIGAVTLGAEFLHPPLRAQTRQPKKVIIAGGGIAVAAARVLGFRRILRPG